MAVPVAVPELPAEPRELVNLHQARVVIVIRFEHGGRLPGGDIDPQIPQRIPQLPVVQPGRT